MIKRTIALRYSKALFELDLTKENLKRRLDDFEFFMHLLNDQPKLKRLLQSPQISESEKKEVLQKCIGNQTDRLFFQFINYLIEKRRLNDLKQIANEYRLKVNEFLGIWEAKMITAVPLEKEIEMKLKLKLENFYHHKIEITHELDPKIIGGAILIVSNKMIDWSLATRLRKMKENLLAVKV